MEYNRLLSENREYKALVAEKELQIRVQQEIIKKKPLDAMETRMIAQSFIDQGYCISKVSEYVEISKSTY